jgi:uncharacterized protein (DUF2461 family)
LVNEVGLTDKSYRWNRMVLRIERNGQIISDTEALRRAPVLGFMH